MKMVFGPDGQMHVGFKSGNMVFTNDNTYVGVGDNFALGSDGSAHFGVGNAIFGSDGSTHLKFGDNPTFLI